MSQMSNHFGPILQKFNLQIHYLEDFGKIKKVHCKEGLYALKRMEHEHSKLLHHVGTLSQRGYRNMVPLIQSNNGEYVVRHHNDYYYLMPWLENEKNYRIEHDIYNDLINEISKVHLVSVKRKPTKRTTIETFIRKLQRQWDERNQRFQLFLENCEQSIYMSPFQLFYCLHFKQITTLEAQSRQWLDQYLNDDLEESRIEREVICHGKMEPSHLLKDGNGKNLLHNFEKSYYGHPVHDFVYFLRRTLYYNPSYQRHGARWYSYYQGKFSFLDHEQKLFFYYVTMADQIDYTILQYQQNRDKTVLQHTRDLQKAIWLLQASHFVANEISNLDFEHNEPESSV